MLVDVRTAIAVRCPWCGSIRLSNINPFQLTGKGSVTVDCECGEELFTLAREKSDSYSLKIACIACENEHIYKLRYKELWKQEVYILNCIYTDIEICFLGEEKHVVDTVKRYEEELDNLISELGLEDFLEDEDFWAETCNHFVDNIDRINYRDDYGKNKIDSVLLKGPKRSK